MPLSFLVVPTETGTLPVEFQIAPQLETSNTADPIPNGAGDPPPRIPQG